MSACWEPPGPGRNEVSSPGKDQGCEVLHPGLGRALGAGSSLQAEAEGWLCSQSGAQRSGVPSLCLGFNHLTPAFSLRNLVWNDESTDYASNTLSQLVQGALV